MKKTLLIITLLIISMLPVANSSELSDNHTINEKTISLDNDDINIEAFPHTLGSSGWVYFNITTKKYTGDTDILLSFLSNDVRPTRIQEWTSYEHTILSREPQKQPKEQSFYDTNTSLWHNETIYVDAFKTISTKSTYYDWKDMPGSFSLEKYQYESKNNWYTLENIPVTSGNTKRVRVWIEIPFSGLSSSSGEYWFSIKPSAYTLQNAISSDKLYTLDPWWNTSWGCRVPIIIDHNYVDTWIHDYPILVILNETISNQANSGDSLRFTLDDNSTLLNFEIEDYNNWGTTNYIWVNVTDISPDVNTLIWCYYNNPSASDGQNVADTWDGYFQGVWHFNDSSYLWESTSNGNHGTAVSTPNDADGIANGVVNFEYDDSEYFNMGNVCDQTTNLFTAEGWFNASQYFANEQTLMNKKWSGTNKWYIQIEDNNNNMRFACIDAEDDVVTADLAGINLDGLYDYFVAQRNADQYFSLGVLDVSSKKWDGNSIKTGDIGTITNTDDLCFASYTGGGDYYDDCLDEYRISNIARNDTYINLTFEVIHNNSAVISLGTIDCSYVPSYTYYLPDINWLHPANLSNNICPCNGSICFNITNPGGNNMNVTIYYTTAGYAGFYYRVNILEFQNISNGTYCICIDNLYPSAHAVGWSEDNVTASSTNEWHNFTFDNFHAVNMEGTGSAVIIPFDGHYFLEYWLVSKNDEAAPKGDVIALRMTNNGHEINASYRQVDFTNQDEERYITSLCHADLDANDIINFQYIVNDLSCQIVMEGDYTTNDTNAFASIEFVGESLGILYNTDYYWYINVTNYNDAGGNESTPRVFTTAENITNCTSVSSNGSTTSTGYGIVGITGIVGILGWLAYIRRRRRYV